MSHDPVSVGSYLNGAERYVVDGLMPWAIAVVRTIVLKVEPRLAAGGRREVDLVLRIARTDFRHRPDRAVQGVDRDDRGRRVGRVRERALDRVERETLQTRIDRRVHPQATRAHRVRPVLALELVTHVIEEVRLPDARVEPPGMKMKVPVRACVRILRRRDVTVREHGAKHLVTPCDRLLRAVERIEHGRRLREPGKQSRLWNRQVLRAFREVRLGRRLDPVRAVAVEHLVHVRLQDPALGALARELDRETRLGRLPAERL